MDTMSMNAEDVWGAMHEPPSYPWIYRVPRGTMIGYATFAVLFGCYGIYLIGDPRITSALMCHCSSGQGILASVLIWFFVVAIVAGALSCAWATYYAAVGKMVLWKDVLEINRPFFIRKLRCGDLIGKRTYSAGRANQYTYLMLIPKEGKPVQVLMNGWFKLDSYFQAWADQIPPMPN
jgi:hypothetical protein